MDRTAFEEDQEMLKRIAVKLLRLAALAERVAVLPHAIRLLVLWWLRPAEAIARDFVAEEAGWPLDLPAAAILGTGGGSRADALRLAFCFRALAAVIDTLLVEAEAYGRQPAYGAPDHRPAHKASMTTRLRRFMAMPGAVAAFAVGRIDTS